METSGKGEESEKGRKRWEKRCRGICCERWEEEWVWGVKHSRGLEVLGEEDHACVCWGGRRVGGAFVNRAVQRMRRKM
jgi:hypothetical protein